MITLFQEVSNQRRTIRRDSRTGTICSPSSLWSAFHSYCSQKASRQHTISFLESLKNAGHIDHAIASYHIPRQRDGKNDGELTLGGMNPKKYDPSYMITVSNINDRGFWEVPIDDIQVNGKSLGLTGRSAVLDTGSVSPQC